MKILGLDLALTNTGWARVELPDEPQALTPHVDLGVIRGQGRDVERLVQIELDLQPKLPVDVVAMEGYAYGTARGSSNAHSLGELGGVIKSSLHRWGIPRATVPPAVLKKYATGKGNASKEAVLVECVRRLGYQGANNNEADAYWLVAMAADRYGQPLVAMPKAHREALEKVEWPNVA